MDMYDIVQRMRPGDVLTIRLTDDGVIGIGVKGESGHATSQKMTTEELKLLRVPAPVLAGTISACLEWVHIKTDCGAKPPRYCKVCGLVLAENNTFDHCDVPECTPF